MTIQEETILARLLEEAPFGSAAEARSALQAALAALRGGMLDDEAELLARDIDAPWAEPLRRGSYRGDLSLEEFYRLAAFHEGRRLSVGAEHAQLACRVLCALMTDSTRQRLRRHLPQLASLFDAPEPAPSVAGAEHSKAAPGREHTLASGRPGSSRPLSESRPTTSRPLSEARPERAHGHSVARSDDPHADTKLSSATGLTQEREGESLARSQRSVPR